MMTVEDKFKETHGWPAQVLSWYEFNRVVEQVWQNGGEVTYAGAGLNRNGKMCVAFKDSMGQAYVVENDVVFTFQRNERAVPRSIV